jgi:hypothetical protein
MDELTDALLEGDNNTLEDLDEEMEEVAELLDGPIHSTKIVNPKIRRLCSAINPQI